MTKFSLLVSVYNGTHVKDLESAFESLIVQTMKPNQIVLVEDGPISYEIKQKIDEYKKYFEEFYIHTFEKNLGLGFALRKGLEFCKYDIVARFDLDDINNKYRFEKQINYMNNNQQVSVLGCQIDEFIDVDGEKIFVSKRNVPLSHEDIVKFSNLRNPLNHPSVIFRKKDILASGSYINIRGYEDYYLWLRVINRGYIIHNMPDYLLYYRVGDDMISRRGGVKYFMYSINSRFLFYKKDLISLKSFLIGCISSLFVSLSPKFIRKFIYYKYLHNERLRK